MKLQAQNREEPEVSLTSLIDVVFLLLIFFMVSTTFDRQAVIKVDLPDAEANVPVEDVELLEVIIDADGNFYVNQEALVNNRRNTLLAALDLAAEGDNQQPVRVRADASTEHQYVVMAMDVLGELGFVNLSIATVQAEAD